MGDIDGCLIAHHLIKTCIDTAFRFRVKGSGGLVHNHKRGILVNGSCNGNFLFLAAGKAYTVFLKFFSYRGGKAVFETCTAFSHTCSVQSIRCAAFIHCGTCRHIFAQGEGEYLKILEHYGKQSAVFFVIILSDIDLIDLNTAFRHIIQAAEQFDKGSLTRPVSAYNGHPRPYDKLQVQILYHIGIAPGIFEGNVVKFH